MVSGHTREVRFETGTTQAIISVIKGSEDVWQIKPVTISIFHRNHTYLSLHSQAGIDINPIVKTIVSGTDQRHCSTTFYQ